MMSCCRPRSSKTRGRWSRCAGMGCTLSLCQHRMQLLRPWRYAAAAGCGFWLLINLGLELAQASSVGEAISQNLPAVFANWPLLDQVGPFLSNGKLDPLDLAFIIFGCGLAFALMEDDGSKLRGLRVAWRGLASLVIVAAGLATIVGSTVVATSGDLNRPKPPEPEEPSPEPDAGPGQVPLARGHQGAALLLEC